MKKITAAAFDQKFEDGEDISGHVDWASGRRPNLQAKRVNVDFPNWMVSGLDQEASRLGITRQALIKIWIADRLKEA